MFRSTGVPKVAGKCKSVAANPVPENLPCWRV